MWKSLKLRTKILIMPQLFPCCLFLEEFSTYSYYASRSMLNERTIETVGYIVESYSNTIYSSLKERKLARYL